MSLLAFQAASEIPEAQQEDHNNGKKAERLLEERYRKQNIT